MPYMITVGLALSACEAQNDLVMCSNYKPRPLMFGGRCQAGKTIVNQLAGALCNHLMMPCFNITKGTSNQRDLFAKTSAGLRGVRVDMTRPGGLGAEDRTLRVCSGCM